MSVGTIYRNRRKADRWEPASTALTVARMLDAAPAFWNEWRADCGEVEAAEWREGGYQLRAVVYDDPDADLSWLGEFTDTWEPGAVSNADSTTWHALKWFIPANDPHENYPYFRRAGMGRAEARQRCHDLARQAMLTAREPEVYGVTVTASLGGRVLGEASCWGIHDEYPHLAYVAEVARECAADAICEADATLARRLGTAREVIA